jgi:hypothetical protein
MQNEDETKSRNKVELTAKDKVSLPYSALEAYALYIFAIAEAILRNATALLKSNYLNWHWHEPSLKPGRK